MRQRVTVVTLGVRDLARARRFYEQLGWETGADPDDDVVFWEIAHNPHWTLTADGGVRL
jgi:catechol 2,3-dioxygenase-like lactoylglutathione lyase family enzyme